jgi:DNA-binding MarR family transcriptional regulator
MSPTVMAPADAQVVDLRRAVARLGRRLRAERSDTSVSTGKISVMSHLLRRGPLTPSELAAAEFVQPQSLSRPLAELEQAGLVSRTPDTTDRRQYLVAITEEGRRTISRDVAGRDAWLALALDSLTVAERGVLHIAARLMDRLADGDAPLD